MPAPLTEDIIILCTYLLTVNITSLVLFFIDKRRAVHRRERIPEAVLMTLAIFGGAPGAFLGSLLFRHKTRKPLFYITLPILTLITVALLWAIAK